jgi:fatty-acid desaturase
MSLFGWPFSPRRLNSIWRDRATRVAHAHFSRDSALALFGSPQGYILTNLVFLTVLALVNPVLPALMAMSLVIEHCRIAFVNACCHIPGFPGNYRNHDTQDQSHNNWILGALTLGFAFHNNHHAHPNQVVLQERWWEWDLEGLVARLLSRM